MGLFPSPHNHRGRLVLVCRLVRWESAVGAWSALFFLFRWWVGYRFGYHPTKMEMGLAAAGDLTAESDYLAYQLRLWQKSMEGIPMREEWPNQPSLPIRPSVMPRACARVPPDGRIGRLVALGKSEMKTHVLIIVAFVAILVSGCSGFRPSLGSGGRVVSASYVAQFQGGGSMSTLWYHGSDDQYHYFSHYVMFSTKYRVRRSELKIPDEFPNRSKEPVSVGDAPYWRGLAEQVPPIKK